MSLSIATRRLNPWLVTALIALGSGVVSSPAVAAGGDSDFTDGLNSAAAVAGVGLVATNLAFTTVDVVLMKRGQRLSKGWSIVELAAAAPIAVVATGYSFQARREELLFTIPLALWTAALTAHGIISLTGGDQDGGGGRVQNGSSWVLTPSFGESAGHEFGGLAAVGRF